MHDTAKRIRAMFLILIMIIIVLSSVSLFIGRFSMSPLQVFGLFKDALNGSSQNSAAYQALFKIRLPRVLLNLLVGAALAGAGASFQGVFHNRLVSPDILGVSSGAGFGAALAIILGKTTGFHLMLFSFIGGMLSVALAIAISRFSKQKNTLSLVLSGIVVAAFFNAMLSFIKLVADTQSQLPSITYWLMGSFASANMTKLKTSAVLIVAGIFVLVLMRWRINILSLGTEEAYTLGINPQLNRTLVIVACTLVTAGSVMSTGIIGWVGMIIPNIARSYGCVDHRYQLPLTILMGSAFMLLLDLLARSISASEIPIGILTAIIGAPLFVFFYFRGEGDQVS